MAAATGYARLGGGASQAESDGRTILGWLAQNHAGLVAGLHEANIAQGAVAGFTSLQHSGRYVRPQAFQLQVMIEKDLPIATQAARLSRGLTYLSGLLTELQIGSDALSGQISHLQAGKETAANVATIALGAGLITILAASSAPALAVIAGAVAIGVGTNALYAGLRSVIMTGDVSAFVPGAGQSITTLWP